MPFSGRRVLVVEDEFLVSLATTDLLESIGCEIVGPAASLATAVQLAQLEALDAAVLDINIAGELIWPAAAELQHRRVPFLFVLRPHHPSRQSGPAPSTPISLPCCAPRQAQQSLR
jgi:DNA-binding NarL/FixJ family response regulator